MSATLRAFYGALIGALTVLLAHPYSRPYVLQGVWFLDDSKFIRSTSMLPENLDTLPEPQNLADSGLWVTTACERELSGHKLTDEQALTVLEVIQGAAQNDPDNSFWRQAEAIFQRRLGNLEEATEAWKTASIASRWNDYQNVRLSAVLDGLANETGRNLAWHYAVVDSRKSSAVSRSAFLFARQLLKGETVDDFDIRLATLRNGKLVRDGSRSVESASFGTETIELAAYCVLEGATGLQGVGGPITPRDLIQARETLLNEALTHGRSLEQEMRTAFQEDDAREAFIEPVKVDETRREMMLTSVFTATLPGTLISIGVIGGLVCIVGWMVSVYKPAQHLFEPPLVFPLGVLAGAAVFFASELFFPSLWAAVLLWSFAIRHDNVRQAVPRGLGSAYGVTIAAIAVGFAIVLSYYFVSRSLPGEYLLGIEGGSPGFAMEDSSILALSGFIASLSVVTAPIWGFIERLAPHRLIGTSLLKFGATVSLGCFALGVAMVPAAVGLDRAVGDSLQKTFQNEPSFYLTQ